MNFQEIKYNKVNLNTLLTFKKNNLIKIINRYILYFYDSIPTKDLMYHLVI